MVKLMAARRPALAQPGTCMMEKTMKAHTLAAFGSAAMILDRRKAAEAGSDCGGVDRRRAGPAMASELAPAALDFALAMRRVEAECYDSL